ncbi:hypothetical protein B0J11DRAFT_321091 [Dendryphion nanum]|uniref:Uncharacterized protein n=1 Tax=Dendryphion nanum TaxID=256645 RepID=A0A9P9ILK4_9PLEO|nr:hypothetical protein B0J11DRAFT_321091 [Dendryphion nanum]
MSSATRNTKLAEKISQMRLEIAPIVHVETGVPPPEFPSTMLELFLLTEDQLDTMAHYYAQITPNHTTRMYPQTMDWDRPILARPREGDYTPENCKLNDYERLKIKMRMFAQFIGMRGAETPRWELERQMELLKNKVDHSIAEEERLIPRKFYCGPSTYP